MTRDHRHQVAAFYDEAASAWDAEHAERQSPLFRRRLHESLRALLEPARGGELAIELGAGTGPYVGTVAPMFHRVVCTDISAGMLEVLRQRRDLLGLANVEAVQQDAGELRDFPDASADAVFCVGMFETVADPGRVLTAARRVLRPGGIFAAITSNGSCPWYALRRHVEGGERPGHIVRYMRAGEVRALAAAAGFEVSLIDCWGALPPGIANRPLARALEVVGVALHASFFARWLGLLAFRLIAK